MNKNYPISEIQEKLANAQNILVCLPSSPRYDQVAAGLVLSLCLQQTGKSISVVCPSPMTVEFNNLVGVDKVSSKIKGTDLVVSFNYLMDNVEKVSYDDNSEKLSLVLKPKAGAPAINEKMVNFSYGGIEADLVFSIGIKNINQLQSIGLSSLSPEAVVNIDNWHDNSNFAMINLIDVDASSFSEIVLGLTQGLGLTLDLDMAQNLFNGLWQATSGMKKADLGADAYEAVAVCLRLGAQKPQISFSKQNELNRPKNLKNVNEKNVLEENSNQPQKPPAEWLEPKIFKGSSNV